MEGGLTESGLEPIEVRVSAWKYVLQFGALGLLFLFSLFMIGIGLIERDSGLLPDLLMTVFGFLGVSLSALGCINAIHFLRDPRLALRITEEGILNRTAWSSTTLVPWEEVVDIRPTRRRWIWEIVLRDPEEYQARQTAEIRGIMRLRKLLGRKPLPLLLGRLDSPREAVVRQLLQTVEGRALAEVREGRRIIGEHAED